MIRDCFYDSKTSCFGSVEGLSITVKCHTFHTKTTCFGVVMLSDTFFRTITLTNKLTLNMLEAKVTLSSKTAHKNFCMIAIRERPFCSRRTIYA